jgi:hypothetical protein
LTKKKSLSSITKAQKVATPFKDDCSPVLKGQTVSECFSHSKYQRGLDTM